MSRASEAILEELHNTIAETLKEELKRYADGDYDFTDEEGIVTKKSDTLSRALGSTIGEKMPWGE